MTDPNIQYALRLHASTIGARETTHSEKCWHWHPGCAMVYAADVIDDLESEATTWNPRD